MRRFSLLLTLFVATAALAPLDAAAQDDEFGDLDGVQEAARHRDKRISARIAASITDAHDYLDAARTVVFVRTDADVAWESGAASALVPEGPADPDALAALVAELGVASSVNRVATAFGWDERF